MALWAAATDTSLDVLIAEISCDAVIASKPKTPAVEAADFKAVNTAAALSVVISTEAIPAAFAASATAALSDALIAAINCVAVMFAYPVMPAAFN